MWTGITRKKGVSRIVAGKKAPRCFSGMEKKAIASTRCGKWGQELIDASWGEGNENEIHKKPGSLGFETKILRRGIMAIWCRLDVGKRTLL